ncbi:MAG: TonB-dependent receptor [Ignavibacteria bacterium]|nr:TonB-dependent receptor [Ignavibacteria bacterium]
MKSAIHKSASKSGIHSTGHNNFILYYIKRLTIHFSLFTFYFILCSLSIFTGEARSQETDTNIYKTPTIEVDEFKDNLKVVPLTLETVKRETIWNKYWMQNVPIFLNGCANINAYSESGASIGHSYITIRGFNQRRLSVMINGVPQNDAEEHEVYWDDLSDITSSLENIQVQRGMSTALYGSSEIGGVINLQTIDYFKNKFLNINAGYGTYNSKRFSLEYSSGLTKNKFGIYGKLSKTSTDGYRNLSWSDLWSYFLSAGKIIGENSVIKLNVYGSPVKNHLAYTGVTNNYIIGKVTGNQSADRKYNPLTYPDESDDFFQPHFELIYNLQADKDLFISNTFSYVRRDGNYINYYFTNRGYNFSNFRLNYFYSQDTTSYKSNCYLRNWLGKIIYETGKGYRVVQSDIAAKLISNGNDFGWYPKIHFKHTGDIGNLILGGEFRLHNSEHSGEILRADALPPGTPENYQYYFYNGKKSTYSVYLNEFTNIEKKISGMVGIQFTHHRYTIDNNIAPYNFSVDYNLMNYRIGLNYNFNEHLRAFMNISVARREPQLSELYDGSDATFTPNFQSIDTVNGVYSNPLIDYEELKDYELGIGYTGNLLKANLNFYLMNYRNEIVSNGRLNVFGKPITSNAGESIHRGIEFEFEYNLLASILSSKYERNPFITLSGNISLSENYYKTYIEQSGIDEPGNIVYGADYSGNKILLSPQCIGNLNLNFNYGSGLNAFITMQYIGKQYLDNTENEKKNPAARLVPGYVHKFIQPYIVFNAGVTLDFISFVRTGYLSKYIKSLEASVKINNILDSFYETTGGINYKGSPVWIPAAERNVFFNLKAGF